MTSRIAPFHPILRPILCEVFPHKLQFHFFRPANLQRRLLLTRAQAISPVPLGNIRFSTRSGRERMSSGIGSGARAAASKSLIEDEADLSDWVSGLKSDSFKKTRVYSDSEGDDSGNKSGRFGRGDGAGKRRRDSDFDKDSDFSGRRGGGGRGGRGGRESLSGRRSDGNEFGGSLRGGRGGGRDSRGGGSSFGGRGGGRDSGRFSRGGGSSFGGRGGGRDSSKFSRGGGSGSDGGLFGGRGEGRGSSKFSRGGRFGGASEERRERSDDYVSRGSGERRGSYDGNMSRGGGERRGSGRGLGMTYGNRGGRSGDRGGLAMKGGGRGTERRGLVITDDEDVEEEDDDEDEETDKGYTSFKELVDSDEADEDEDEDEDEEEEKDEEVEVVRAKLEKGSFPKSSPQSSDSYLSESR